jgi:exopolyphosphatase/guanosine-5'-triphosphate,3'-diphosphate pyrophosphatase
MPQLAATDAPPSPAVRRQLASVDLGSNSFRLLVVDVEPSSAGEQLRLVDQIKETVRLGAGLDHDQVLSLPARQRALETLARFGERLQGFDPDSVRAVATNTFRVARNSEQFLRKASAALGFPIEVIAGREEARLIYLGASHSLPLDHRPRLIVDIGGGSTECIVGVGHEPKRRESFQMGCVSLTQSYFRDGRLTRGAMRKARLHCGELLAGQVRAFRRLGWDEAVGTSGTAKSLWQVGAAEFGFEAITPASLAKLEAMALDAGSVSALRAQGLKPEREPVFCAGLAVMQAIFEEFQLERMDYCDAALREGILHDLLGRAAGADRREITISHLVERYRMDDPHGRQVAAVARELLSDLEQGATDAHRLQLLDWAARIREIGSFIAHADAHRHGSYIVAHADLPGFSGSEQRQLALLVLGQSGGLRKLRDAHPDAALWPLVLCLRLAVILQRRRDGRPTPIRLRPAAGGARAGWTIELDREWATAHPLTDQSLARETAQWRETAVCGEVDYRVV